MPFVLYPPQADYHYEDPAKHKGLLGAPKPPVPILAVRRPPLPPPPARHRCRRCRCCWVASSCWLARSCSRCLRARARALPPGYPSTPAGRRLAHAHPHPALARRRRTRSPSARPQSAWGPAGWRCRFTPPRRRGATRVRPVPRRAAVDQGSRRAQRGRSRAPGPWPGAAPGSRGRQPAGWRAGWLAVAMHAARPRLTRGSRPSAAAAAGHGRALLEAIEDICRALGIPRILLCSTGALPLPAGRQPLAACRAAGLWPGFGARQPGRSLLASPA